MSSIKKGNVFKSMLIMKKIKIMLAFVAVLSTVGAVLAFKVASFGEGNIYCSTFTPGDTCQKVLYKTTTGPNEADDPCGGNKEFYKDAACNMSYTTIAGSGAIVTRIKPVTNL